MIPSALRKHKSWVCVRADSKVPMQIADIPASPSNPDTWESYVKCKLAVADGSYDYLGYVFHDEGIIGIDIDYGVTDGVIDSEVQSIIDMCNTYTELSRSGRGVHIFLKGNIPFDGRNNRQGVEIYKTGRYFIMTDNPVNNVDIRENQSAIDMILKNHFSIVDVKEYNISSKIYSPVYHIEKGKVPYPIYPEIGQGSRNLSLLSVGGSLLSAGYTDREIYLELLKVNQTACRPPLSVSEIQAIINSLGRYRR